MANKKKTRFHTINRKYHASPLQSEEEHLLL